MRITEKDISIWPQKRSRDAQGNLPILIRRLIHSTVDKSNIVAASFPGEDGVRKKGWDGVLEIKEGNAWVPSGSSLWEMGCDENPKKKAEGDYKKRTESTSKEIREATTFVFVTPRDWSKKDGFGQTKNAWVEEKEQNGDWGNVRAIDAGDLEEWLEISPLASVWLCSIFGYITDGLLSPDEYLDHWSNATNPALPGSFLLRDRDSDIRYLREWMSKPPAPLSVVAHSKEEAIAFCCEALKKIDLASFDNVLIIETKQALSSISTDEENPLLILESDELGRSLGRNTQRYHVVIAYGQGAEHGESKLVLSGYSHEGFVEEVEKLDKTNPEARKLALSCGRSLSVLRRQISINPTIKKPSWANDQNAKDLIPAVLVGAWSREKEGDVEALEELAQCSNQDIERTVNRLVKLDEAPIEIIGNIRRITSRYDTLFAVAPYLAEEDFSRFFSIAEKALFTRDPRIDLNEEEQWMASLYGKEHPNSGRFLRGIADTLILLSMHGDVLTANSTSRSPKARADGLVRKILNDADSDRWKSIHGLLTFMAEASPEAFLDAIDCDLDKPSPAIGYLFPQETSSSGSCPQANLLWALELLAWSPKYLARVSQILLRLSQFRLPDNVENNPKNTFISIYLPWLPQTNADVAQRSKILDGLMTAYPSELWNAFRKLIYKTIGSTNSRPRWRDIDDKADKSPSREEVRKSYEDIGERLFLLAENHTQRMAELIGAVNRIPPKEGERLWDMIESWIQSTHSDDQLNTLRQALRHHLYANRLRTDEADEIEKKLVRPLNLYEKIKPQDLVFRHKWLFDNQYIKLPEGREGNHREREKRVRNQKREALEEIVKTDGIDGIFKLAKTADDPVSVGLALSTGEIKGIDKVGFALQIIASDFEEHHKSNILKGLIGFKEDETSQQFSDAVICELKKEDNKNDLVHFLKCMPMKQATWDLVKTEGEVFHKRYWQEVQSYHYLEWSEKEAQYALDKLIEMKRPRSALHWTNQHQKQLRTEQLTALLRLFALHGDLEENIRLPSSWDIEQVFEELDSRDDIDLKKLAELEYYLFSAIEHSSRGAKYLNQQISEDPNLFAQLVSYIYRRNDGQKETNTLDNLSTESQKMHANSAFKILHEWKVLR